MTPQPASAHPMVEAARRLGSRVAASGDEIDRDRALPSPLVDALTEVGVFQMYLPSTVGGPQVAPTVGFEVVDALARRDGSVGWCTQVAAAVTVFLAWLDPDAVARMVAATSDPLHIAGSARPLGQAREATSADGHDQPGYVISGRWNFASGVRHANWFLATAFVPTADGGRRPRSMFVPVSDGRIVDNWDVLGMRGTGSDDFVVEDVFVPHDRVCARRWIAPWYGTVYDPRLLMVGAWAPTAGVGTGLAQGAIDTLTAMGDLSSAGSPDALRSRPAVQESLALAVTRTGAAQAYVRRTLAEAWELVDGAPPEREEPVLDAEIAAAVARAQLAITHALNEAVAVADLCFHAAGTNAISTSHRLERILRDAHTAVQHSAGQAVHRRVAGRVLLGLESGPFDPERNGPATPRA